MQTGIQAWMIENQQHVIAFNWEKINIMVFLLTGFLTQQNSTGVRTSRLSQNDLKLEQGI